MIKKISLSINDRLFIYVDLKNSKNGGDEED